MILTLIIILSLVITTMLWGCLVARPKDEFEDEEQWRYIQEWKNKHWENK